MGTDEQGQSGDGILVDPHQACGPADAASLGEMLKNRHDLLVREFGVEERRALGLGEAVPAGSAKEEAMTSPGEVVDDERVAGIALAKP